MWGAAGAGCTPAIVSARTPIYPNGVRDPSSTSSGTGLGTSRAGPLTVPRGSPVRTVSPTGREATGGGPRRAAPSLDTALNSLEASFATETELAALTAKLRDFGVPYTQSYDLSKWQQAAKRTSMRVAPRPSPL